MMRRHIFRVVAATALLVPALSHLSTLSGQGKQPPQPMGFFVTSTGLSSPTIASSGSIVRTRVSIRFTGFPWLTRRLLRPPDIHKRRAC